MKYGERAGDRLQDGSSCIKCGAFCVTREYSGTVPGACEEERKRVYIEVFCDACEASWTDIFELVAVQGVGDGIEVYEGRPPEAAK